jgi:hypothetical protein
VPAALLQVGFLAKTRARKMGAQSAPVARPLRITCRYFARYGRSPRFATFFLLQEDGVSERLVYGSAATNSTPSLPELATIHSTAYPPRVAIGDGLRSIDIYRNTRAVTCGEIGAVAKIAAANSRPMIDPAFMTVFLLSGSRASLPGLS